VIGQRLTILRSASDAGRNARVSYGVWLTLWLAGHAVGGFAIGGVLGWLGSCISVSYRTAGTVLLSVLCLIWALAELKIIRIPMPQWPRQVQQLWLARLPWNLIAIGYGVQLGSAVATRIKTTTTYAALCCALLVGSAGRGGLIMALFGFSRAVPALLAAPLVASPERSIRFAIRLDSYSGMVDKVNAGTQIGAGVALAWSLLAAIA
jgi:hypothetical protein